MLSALIRVGQLTTRERESFEGMWDYIDGRRGKLSPKQQAWVEKVYYGQNLDKPHLERDPRQSSPKVGFAYAKVKRTVSVSTIEQFEVLCPHIKKGSKAHARVSLFFRTGGRRFELRPQPKESQTPKPADADHEEEN